MTRARNERDSSETLFVRSFDEQFRRLHERSRQLVLSIPPGDLYRQPRESAKQSPIYSCGEHILRSAAAVEQTAGGITANLWDDPFEWTLPETLSTPERVIEYLDEVEATRRRALSLVGSDEELRKEIAAPSGEMKTLFALFAETLVRAAHHQGRAFATFRIFSDAQPPYS